MQIRHDESPADCGYVYSLPERLVRSLSALIGGTVHQLGDSLCNAVRGTAIVSSTSSPQRAR
jgi:hypothetical protein